MTELLQGISMHMMVRNPPIDRLATLITYMLPHVHEVVIVDTGSDPQTVEKMKSWQYPGTAPVIVVHEDFVNFSATRNKGLALHRYEWTVGFDPDEWPSWEMIGHIRYVTSPEGMAKFPAARGWVYWTYNWWDGVLGPEMDYHWHTRLWKTKGSSLYRPVHELVNVQGKPELTIRGTNELPNAPKGAYLIHSKGREEITKADTMYSNMGEVSH